MPSGRVFFLTSLFSWADNTELYYSFNVRGMTADLQKAMWPALDALDNDPNWDWSQFDVDGDGYLDAGRNDLFAS
jgi:hypothetical protein